MEIYDNWDDRGSNLQSPAPEADALSIGPPEPMASRAKSMIGMRIPKENDETQPRHGRDMAETGFTQGLDRVYTGSTLGLHKVYTRSTLGLHCVYTGSTLSLR